MIVTSAATTLFIAVTQASGTDICIVNSDPIQPGKIEHLRDTLFDDNGVVQDYNYLQYHFEADGHAYRARHYLGDSSVSVFGPLKPGTNEEAQGVSVSRDVLLYLARRYLAVEFFGKDGYAPVDLTGLDPFRSCMDEED